MDTTSAAAFCAEGSEGQARWGARPWPKGGDCLGSADCHGVQACVDATRRPGDADPASKAVADAGLSTCASRRFLEAVVARVRGADCVTEQAGSVCGLSRRFARSRVCTRLPDVSDDEMIAWLLVSRRETPSAAVLT